MANNIMFVIFSNCSNRNGYVAISCAGGKLERDPLMVHALLHTKDHFDVLEADRDDDGTAERLMAIGKHLLHLKNDLIETACFVDVNAGSSDVEVYDEDEDEDEEESVVENGVEDSILELSSSSSSDSDDEEHHVDRQDISSITSKLKCQVRKML